MEKLQQCKYKFFYGNHNHGWLVGLILFTVLCHSTDD